MDSSKHGKEEETLPPDLSGSLHLQGMFIFTVQTYQQRKAGSLTGKDEDIKIKNMKFLEIAKQILSIRKRMAEITISGNKQDVTTKSGLVLKSAYYQLIKYYIDRIPDLSPYKPISVDQSVQTRRFNQLTDELKNQTRNLQSWTFLPYSEHSRLS